jgi:hypothetical protein
MKSSLLRLTWLALMAVLISLPLTLALADAGAPTPTPLPPPPPTATWVFPLAPTATPTTLPYYTPGAAEPNAAAPVEGQTTNGEEAVVLEPDFTIQAGAQNGEETQEEGGFPLWPIIIVVVVGVGLVLGIIGYFVFVRRSP